jgi:hypothetical protein
MHFLNAFRFLMPCRGKASAGDDQGGALPGRNKRVKPVSTNIFGFLRARGACETGTPSHLEPESGAAMKAAEIAQDDDAGHVGQIFSRCTKGKDLRKDCDERPMPQSGRPRFAGGPDTAECR